MRRAPILVLVLIFAGCGPQLTRSGARKYGTSATPVRTKDVGSAVALPSETPTPVATPKPTPGSRFTLRLTDTHGLHPAGIPIRISGPIDQVVKTNANGEIEVRRAGVYNFEVVTGCGPDVEVFSGGRAGAGVTPGKPSSGELRVDWRHRYAPSPPVFSDVMPPWPRNTDVRVRFKVLDRCTQRFAPNASFPTWRFGVSKNLKVSKTVLRSDAKSEGSVTVNCAAPGDVKLVAFDGANPTDTFNVARESSDYAPPSCA